MRTLIARWRLDAIAITTGTVASTESQRAIAWRFLKTHGVA